MGEIADDAISGRVCSCCGVYFVEEHGYPVLCAVCWEEWTPSQRRGACLQRATEREVGEE